MSGFREPNAGVPEDLIAEAARWCARKDPDGEASEDHRELRGWLADDPRRRAAFDAVSRTMTDPALLAALREVDSTGSMALQAPPSPQRRPLNRRPLNRKHTRAWMAAGLMLMCAAWFAWPVMDFAWAPQTLVSTAPGQTRSLSLPDGSRVELSGGTSLQIRLGSRRRLVRMERGEAFFTVARDPHRPFVVETVEGRVEVRGTQFDLNQTRDGLQLAVHHGRVAFGGAGLFAHTIDLVANERAELSGGALSAIKHFDPDAGDWRTGWLETDGITLAELAERLKRQRNVAIEVDSALVDKRIAGRFRLNDPETLLRRLAVIHGFSVTRVEKGLAIHPRSTEI